MPYLKDDEIVINGKTVSSTASDVDDADESFFENKVLAQGDGGHDDENTNSSTSSYDSQQSDSPSRKRKHFDADAVIAKALNYLSTSEPARDELWQFMSYLHTVLKSLPPHLQLELKHKIQTAMYEVEKQDLDDTGRKATAAVAAAAATAATQNGHEIEKKEDADKKAMVEEEKDVPDQ